MERIFAITTCNGVSHDQAHIDCGDGLRGCAYDTDRDRVVAGAGVVYYDGYFDGYYRPF